MSTMENKIRSLIKEGNLDYLGYYIEKKFISKLFRKKEIIKLLPLIIENTTNSNYSWLDRNSEYMFTDKCFLTAIIDNIDRFDFKQENQIMYLILYNIYCYSLDLLDDELLKKLDDNVLKCNCKKDFTIIEDLYKINSKLIDKYPDMTSYMSKKYILNEQTLIPTIAILDYKGDMDLELFLYKNIDFILNDLENMDLFLLKKKVGDIFNETEKSNEIKLKIKNKIDESPQEYTSRFIKYNYKFVDENILDNDSIDKLNTIVDVLYLIIEDICKNENVEISDINYLSSGSFSSVLQIGNKVLKIGNERGTPRFHNNPYINAPLLRKYFKINEETGIFVEVNELLKTRTSITEEELYQFYRNIRKLGIIWVDVALRNVGILLKDNKLYWRQELPITDEVLGLDSYKGPKIILEKGSLVICDNDILYDEHDKEENINYYSNPLFLKFEKRYQEEVVTGVSKDAYQETITSNRKDKNLSKCKTFMKK